MDEKCCTYSQGLVRLLHKTGFFTNLIIPYTPNVYKGTRV